MNWNDTLLSNAMNNLVIIKLAGALASTVLTILCLLFQHRMKDEGKYGRALEMQDNAFICAGMAFAFYLSLLVS